MSRTRVGPSALLLSLSVLMSAVMPVQATDPSPSPKAPAEAADPVPGIHAEMLLERGGEGHEFQEGGAPAPFSPPAGGGGTVSVSERGAGSVVALPNGLSHEVFGYLPYWVLGSVSMQHLRYDRVSTIAYFAVSARADGTLAKTTTTGAPTTEWAGWNSSAMTDVITKSHQRGVRVVLTLTMMAWNGDYSAMTALLGSSTNRARLIQEIRSTVSTRGADGVNVDFEPVPSTLRSQFTTFVRELKAGLVAEGGGAYVSVATMAGAASWSTGYDVAALTAAGAADALMVMAYDFSWSGSARAGGVAPIDSPYIFDARTAMRDYLTLVPAAKLIWGVPYYGRAWTTQSATAHSLTCRSSTICPTAKPASEPFGRTWAPRYIDALQAAKENGRLWDGTGQVPWYRYQSSTYGTWVQGYYDDAVSLTAKYRMVKSNGLRGIGIWHLLMDGSRTELWDTIFVRFGPLPFTDIADSAFVFDIVWLADQAITGGCSPTTFCPRAVVTREQMASFLVRALDLPSTATDYFADDAGSAHQGDINRLAASGITGGCAPGSFCPRGTVTREQMASFLARALDLSATTTDYFTDDGTSAHEGDINRLAASGITGGCGTRTFCPRAGVTREQMAAFLHRGTTR